MIKSNMDLTELPAKHDQGDLLDGVAEAVLPLGSRNLTRSSNQILQMVFGRFSNPVESVVCRGAAAGLGADCRANPPYFTLRKALAGLAFMS